MVQYDLMDRNQGPTRNHIRPAPPTRLKFAQQQAQDATLRAIVYNGPSSSMSEPAYKMLLLSSWLLLGRPAENASDANCASFLETRLDLF